MESGRWWGSKSKFLHIIAMDIDKIRLFRITHIDNILHIINNGITHRASDYANPQYVNIGDVSLIDTRSARTVLVDNGNRAITSPPSIVLGDFIPFYFGVRMPMLYVIQTGGNFVEQATSREDIVYLVCSLASILASTKEFYFSDGHATDNFTSFYDNTCLQLLPNIVNWTAVKASYWGGLDNLNLKRKKQAEFLVKDDIGAENIIGFGCYNEFSKNQLIELGVNEDKIKIIPQAYF